MRTIKPFIKSAFFLGLAAIFIFSSCRKKENEAGYWYNENNGTGTVTEGQDVYIDDDREITNQLNVNGGNATLGEGTVIGSDLNQNAEGNTTIEGRTVIKNNANANGNLNIYAETVIGTDFNINDTARIMIDLSSKEDTVFIGNNVNVNDSLIIKRGVVQIGTDFNINATGVVNVSDSAQLIVMHDLHQSGRLHGNRNVTVQHVFHDNNAAGTFEEPLPEYEEE